MDGSQLPIGCMCVPPAAVTGPVAMGADLKPSKWDVCFSEVVPSRLLGRFVPRLIFVGRVTDEDTVLWLMKQYRCQAAVSDSRPDATIAARLQTAAQAIGIKFWRSSYLTTPSDVELQENVSEGIIRVERTMTMDNVHHALQTGMGLAIPQNYLELKQGGFVSNMCAPVRMPIVWHGRPWYRWTENVEDDSFHAVNYMLLAIKMGRLSVSGSFATAGASRGIVESSIEKDERDEDWQDGNVVLEA